MRDSPGNARQHVWQLIKKHPELQRAKPGDIVARHRHYSPNAHNHVWRTDWETVLSELQALLHTSELGR